MKISSRFTGSELKEYTTKIEWRQTTNYAASIGDNNPLYFDNITNKTLFAPPMFVVAVTWQILGKIWEYIQIKDFPLPVLMKQVHYTEDIIIHRLIKANDKLTISGKLAAILPHKSGTYMVMQFDARDKSDSPVFTEYIGALMRGVECEDEGKGSENLIGLPESSDDNSVWEKSVFIDPLLSYIYDGCSDIVFPIHTSPQFAKNVALPGIILQGTATLALAVREITNTELAGDPHKIQSLHCRFTGMVVPGTNITIRLTKRNKEDLHFAVLNVEGQMAISKGIIRTNE